MCLHGLALSGHEQSVFMPFEDSGKRDIPAASKASSIFWGISSASNFAANMAFCDISSMTLFHASSASGFISIFTEYGSDIEPCTLAVTLPGASLKSSTCPLLAYLLPRSSLLLHPNDSSTLTQRFDHHVSPMFPLLLLAFIPPSTLIG